MADTQTRFAELVLHFGTPSNHWIVEALGSQSLHIPDLFYLNQSLRFSIFRFDFPNSKFHP